MIRFGKAADGPAAEFAWLRTGAGSLHNLGRSRDDGCGCPAGG